MILGFLGYIISIFTYRSPSANTSSSVSGLNFLKAVEIALKPLVKADSAGWPRHLLAYSSVVIPPAATSLLLRAARMSPDSVTVKNKF